MSRYEEPNDGPSRERYLEWLQNSSCHIYLSQPYVCSWSLLDAISTGTPLVVNDTPPIMEYASRMPEVMVINNTNVETLFTAISKTYKKRHIADQRLIREKRSSALAELSEKASLDAWGLVTGLDLDTSH